jgi:hypothetical protein
VYLHARGHHRDNFSINTGYSLVQTYQDQKNFVITVLYLEPTAEFPDGLVITGGNDNIIYVYKPSEPFATFTFKEHSNAGDFYNL